MAFSFYTYVRSPVVTITISLTVAFISFIIFQSLPKDAAPTAKVIAFLIPECVSTGLLAAALVLTVVLSISTRRNKALFTEHTITLGDTSFTEETEFQKTDQKWSGVQKLARTQRHIFVYMSQYAAHAIPRRAFQDQAHWDSFYERCRQKSGQ